MAGVAVIWLVIIGTSIWVAIDASNIGARRGLIKGLGNMGPAGWFFSCLLLWIIGFPVYLAKRSAIKAAAVGSNVPSSATGDARQVVSNALQPSAWPPPTQGQQHSGQVAGSGITSKADELIKLDALRRSGVLTEEEFAAQKAKVLS